MFKTLLSRVFPAVASVVTAANLLFCPATTQATETIIYLHNDISGSPQAATDDLSGNLLWKESYTPYGERTVNSPASAAGKGTNQLYFHGKKVEDLNGGVHLSYFGARYYDPSLGRFLQIDPQPFDPNSIHSFNRYAYGNNNPYKFTDPDGRTPLWVPMALHIGGGAVFGGASAAAFNAVTQYYMTGHVELKGIGGVFDAMGEGAQIGAILGPAYAGYAGSVRGAAVVEGSVSAGSRLGIPGGPKIGASGGPGAGKVFAEDIKDAARTEAGNVCVFCGTPTTRQPGPTQSHIDHAQPKVRGGNNTLENAQNTCRTCNLSKGTKNTVEFLGERN